LVTEFDMCQPSPYKPEFPPSYDLHVSRADRSRLRGSGNYAGPDFLSLQGYDLRHAISHVYEFSPIRIHLPALLNDGTPYNLAMVLPTPEDGAKLRQRFAHALLDHFGLEARREPRATDAHVLSGPFGNRLGLRPLSAAGVFLGHGSLSAHRSQATPITSLPATVALDSITSASVDGSIDDFCRLLEKSLERPVVNETTLAGYFALRVKADEKSAVRFVDCLREQTGLVLAMGLRQIEVLVIREC
jgi:uncharacterized protein (TIGR03435 family)